MTEADRVLFLTTVGREFCESFTASGEVSDISSQDCYDPLVEILGKDFSPRDFHEIDDAAVLKLRDEFRDWLEVPEIGAHHIQHAVATVCTHWPISERAD